MIDPVLVGLGESVTFSSPNYAANPNVTRFCWKFEVSTWLFKGSYENVRKVRSQSFKVMEDTVKEKD